MAFTGNVWPRQSFFATLAVPILVILGFSSDSLGSSADPCERALTGAAAYEQALTAAFQGRRQEAGLMVSRLINEAYTPVVAFVERDFSRRSPNERIQLVNETLQSALVTGSLSRASEAFESEVQAVADRLPENALRRISLAYRSYLSEKERAKIGGGLGSLPEHVRDYPRESFSRFVMFVPEQPRRDASGWLTPWAFYPTNVTAYGPKFSQDLIFSALILESLISRLPEELLQSQMTQYRDVILQETARGQNFHHEDYAKAHRVFIDGLREGLLTILQTVTLLMAERLAAFPQPEDLFRLLALPPAQGGTGIINKMSVIAPGGFIGPYSLSGFYLKDLLQFSESTGLVLNPAWRRRLVETRVRRAEELFCQPMTEGPHYVLGLAAQYHTAIAPTGSMGTGCPVAASLRASEDSPLQQITTLLFQVYEQVRQGQRPGSIPSNTTGP